MKRKEMHLRPSREESHQARAPSKGPVQRDHSREDRQNRVRALLDRGQSQDKDPPGRDPGKVRDHQARGLNQARVPLAKDPLGRPPGKVKDHQVQAPNKVGLPNKDLVSLDPNSKGHQALGLILESQLRAEGLLVSRVLGNLEVDSVHCVRPPS